jgi:hypothetical protein
VLFATHLLVGALLGRATSLPTVALVCGAALPDIVDKPLAWAGLFEMFHTVGHTALLLPLAVLVARTGQRGLAVAVGWSSHLFLDAFHIVVNGRPTDALAIPPGEFFWFYLWSPSFFIEVGLWLVGIAVAGRMLCTHLTARGTARADP